MLHTYIKRQKERAYVKILKFHKFLVASFDASPFQMCCGSAQQWPHMPQQQITSLTFSMDKFQQRPNGLGWEWPTYWWQLMILDSCGMRLVIKRYLTTGQLLKRSRERGSDEHEIPIITACLEYCTHVKTVMLQIEA
jgi:hypothetical protein